MTKELPEQKPGPEDSANSDGDTAPASKRGRKKEMAPERAIELQTRQRAIGQELRRMFEDVIKEPVPAEFLELLQKIDRKRED